jgi:hypothetical protein
VINPLVNRIGTGPPRHLTSPRFDLLPLEPQPGRHDYRAGLAMSFTICPTLVELFPHLFSQHYTNHIPFQASIPQLSLLLSSISYGYDVERQAGLDVRAFPQVTKNMPDIRDRAGQGCFVCLESPRQGQYAALVPCLRPAPVHRVVGLSEIFSDNPKPIYEKTMPWNNACESDNDIYRPLVDTCYQYLGRWKRWLPYYGITEVPEVNVRLKHIMLVSGEI